MKPWSRFPGFGSPKYLSFVYEAKTYTVLSVEISPGTTLTHAYTSAMGVTPRIFVTSIASPDPS